MERHRLARGKNLVVQVGDVSHQGHVELVADLEPSSQLVEDHCGSEMTDVRRSLNSRTAQIDADVARSQGRERA